MISKDDLKHAISLNSEIINENRPDWDDRLLSSLKSTWVDRDARQLYWNILALMSIKTGGGVKYNPKSSPEINLIIGSRPFYVTVVNFTIDEDEVKDRLLLKGIFPEIVDRLKIKIFRVQ
jgi:hypothetical protein